MIFSEEIKIDKRYKDSKRFKYKTTDSFGIIEFISPKKLNAEEIDEIFMVIFNLEGRSRTLKGKIVDKDENDTGIRYKFLRKNPWKKEKQLKESIN